MTRGKKEICARRPAWKTLSAPRIDTATLFLGVSLIFLAPNVALALSLRPAMAAIVLAGCVGAAAILWREGTQSDFLRAPLDGVQFSLCLALGLALCLLGGEGHIFLPKTDWLVRDAVLSDIVKNGTTVLYRVDGRDYFLRAPLGMYLLPAGVGRLFGIDAAYLALIAQNSLLIGAVLYFVALIAHVRRAPMIFLLLGFSGLDIIGSVAAAAIDAGVSGKPLSLPMHLEWWIRDFSPLMLQYSSHVTQIFWVPNHMAPGWWFATLLLLHLRRAVSFSALLAACGPLMIWSPLIAAGAAPFVILLATRQPPRALFSPRSLAAAGAALCFLPIAAYLVIDPASLPHDWLIARRGFFGSYLAFILIELPQAAVVLYCWRYVAMADWPALLLALIVLLILPVYKFGSGNDLLTRASIPALFILAFHFARIAVLTRAGGGALASVVSTLVLLSAATPIVEIISAVAYGSYAISDCNLLTSARKESQTFATNYLARVDKAPAWLIDFDGAPPALTDEDRKCWPDHPLLDAHLR